MNKSSEILLSHKTIFVLDHSAGMSEPCGVPIEIDSGCSTNQSKDGKGFTNYFSFIPPVTKSFWTVAVEMTLEYGRVVWDLFQDDHLLSFVLSDEITASELMPPWESEYQNFSSLIEAFASYQPPEFGTKCSNQRGLTLALEILSAASEYQNDPDVVGSNNKSINKGRIICITSAPGEESESIEHFFLSSLNQINKSAATSDSLLQIHECELVILCLRNRESDHSRNSSRPLIELSPVLRSEIHILSADKLYDRMMKLCMTHHDLIHLTVTGIPMKEEQNAHSSSNYDVQLFCPKISSLILESNLLKWSSPCAAKASGLSKLLLHPCVEATRITPVDVNSRPSTCLSNFVVGGRMVTLEVLKSKVKCNMSYMLVPHGGEMWLHIMETARNILEDPPSVTEGVGGRVTDYRIQDFIEFIESNKLVPYGSGPPQDLSDSEQSQTLDLSSKKTPSSSSSDLDPTQLAKDRLRKKTAFWPLALSDSPLFSMSVHLEPILKLMTKDTLSDSERITCERTIWDLMAIEARGDAPPTPAHFFRKGLPPEEQWKVIYNLIEAYLQAHQFSLNHEKILNCFVESRKLEIGRRNAIGDSESEKMLFDSSLDVAIKSMEQIISGDHGKLKTVVAVSTDSPMSPPPADQQEIPISLQKPKPKIPGQSLLSLWKKSTEKQDCRILDFSAKLYSHSSPANGSSGSSANQTTVLK